MQYRISLGIIILLTITTGTIFAQESLISVQTDDNHYDEGDTIVVSGKAATVIFGTPVTLQLFSEGSLVDVAQITIAQDGTYSHTIIAEGPLWQKTGNYIIKASYGEGHIAETEFSYTPKSEVVINTDNFEVDAGSKGTFDVEYTIIGATIKNMEINVERFSLEVYLDSTDEGSITLSLPREFIGAEKQNGKDETFIILIDDTEVPYEESAVFSESRVVTINFEAEDSKIEIIGTYAIPEFGMLVMIILSVGITIMIIASRTKFQIKI